MTLSGVDELRPGQAQMVADYVRALGGIAQARNRITANGALGKLGLPELIRQAAERVPEFKELLQQE